MSDRPAAIRKKISAGGIVFRRAGESQEVVLIRPSRGDAITLPKGEVGNGETWEEAALREVREETGLSSEIRADLGSVTYWFYLRQENVKYRKTVHYYLMEYVGGSPEDHDHEVEEVIWSGIDEAIERVSYRTDRDILRKAKEVLTGGMHGKGC